MIDQPEKKTWHRKKKGSFRWLMISLTLVLAEVQLMTSSSRPEVDLWSSFCCNSSCCCFTMKLISNKRNYRSFQIALPYLKFIGLKKYPWDLIWVFENHWRLPVWMSRDNGRDGMHRPGNVECCGWHHLRLLQLLMLLSHLMMWWSNEVLVLWVFISCLLRFLSHGHLFNTHKTSSNSNPSLLP